MRLTRNEVTLLLAAYDGHAAGREGAEGTAVAESLEALGLVDVVGSRLVPTKLGIERVEKILETDQVLYILVKPFVDSGWGWYNRVSRSRVRAFDKASKYVLGDGDLRDDYFDLRSSGRVEGLLIVSVLDPYEEE